jgi:hypothetical protein
MMCMAQSRLLAALRGRQRVVGTVSKRSTSCFALESVFRLAYLGIGGALRGKAGLQLLLVLAQRLPAP